MRRGKKLLGGIIHRLPQNALSRTMGRITSTRFSRMAIRRYIRHYRIDVDCIEKPVEEYRSLKEFFTRRLKPGTRPIAPGADTIISPVDGTVSQMGDIQEGTLIQAKGLEYSVSELLGCSPELSQQYQGGKFITIYLSPRDYHRIHMPVTGTLKSYSYVPGRLYPVNRLGVEQVDRLFARNERLVTFIDSPEIGSVAVVKVGALFVGSVKVTYCRRTTTNVKRGRSEYEPIKDTPLLQKGEELGWFEFGSTVILLFENGKIDWAPEVKEGAQLKMGQALAKRK